MMKAEKRYRELTLGESLVQAQRQAIRYAEDLADLYHRERVEARELKTKIEELSLVQRQSILYAEELQETYLAEKDKAKRLEKALKEIEEAYDTTLVALVNALDAREHEVQAHSQRVMEYTLHLARRSGVEEEALVDIKRGSLLHDIGKIGISDNILLKPGPLNPEEWKEMKKHPGMGFNIIKGIRFLEGAAGIILSHQERFDGTGYPRGLKGEEIPLGARLFAVVDTLDAMTSDRPYRKALTFEIAREEIIRCTGTQFDPKVVDTFLGIPKEEWMGIREKLYTTPQCKMESAN